MYTFFIVTVLGDAYLILYYVDIQNSTAGRKKNGKIQIRNLDGKIYKKRDCKKGYESIIFHEKFTFFRFQRR
jgi:hypothetical protein